MLVIDQGGEHNGMDQNGHYRCLAGKEHALATRGQSQQHTGGQEDKQEDKAQHSAYYLHILCGLPYRLVGEVVDHCKHKAMHRCHGQLGPAGRDAQQHTWCEENK